jgi:hypothetical protein
MKFIILLSTLIFSSCLTNKYVERKIIIEPIGWQFSLTSGTIFKDSAFDSKGRLTDEIPTDGPSLRIFTIKDSSFGSFSAYLRKDTLKFIDWKEWHDKDTKWYFEKLRQLPQFQILETKYYTSTIDSVNFLIQYDKYIKKGKADTTYVYHHYGRINGIELDISFAYTDQIIGKKYMDIINKSKFID